MRSDFPYDLAYYAVLLSFVIGELVSSYLTYTTENAWVKFSYLCFGLLIFSIAGIVRYAIYATKRKKRRSSKNERI